MGVLVGQKKRPPREKKVKMTLTVESSVREALVQEAFDTDTSLSSIVRRLMKKHIKESTKNNK